MDDCPRWAEWRTSLKHPTTFSRIIWLSDMYSRVLFWPFSSKKEWKPICLDQYWPKLEIKARNVTKTSTWCVATPLFEWWIVLSGILFFILTYNGRCLLSSCWECVPWFQSRTPHNDRVSFTDRYRRLAVQQHHHRTIELLYIRPSKWQVWVRPDTEPCVQYAKLVRRPRPSLPSLYGQVSSHCC